MEFFIKKQLEERLLEAVDTILSEGDLDYLRSLSRPALGAVIENELRFLGLYVYGDEESPMIIHNIVEQHLDQWRTQYLSTNIRPLYHAT
jgi:hypothetical protein